MTLKKFLTKKIIVISGIIILSYALIGFFVFPVLGRNLLVKKLSNILDRQVMIEKMNFNPFSLAASLESIEIRDKDKEIFFSSKKIFIDLNASSVFTLTPSVSGIFLKTPT